jgi:glycosyltransferase involved in cell wall biosynthesis
VTIRNFEAESALASEAASVSHAAAHDRPDAPPPRARRRVTLVISSLRAGGAERVLSRMANYWAEHGWPVTMVTLEPTTNDFYALHPSVERVGLGVSKNSSGIWQAVRNNLHRIRMLRRAIRASRPDVVVSFMVPTTIITLLATRMWRLPVLVSERMDPVRSPVPKIWATLRRMTYPLAHAVVVQTPEAQSWADGFLRKEAVHVIPNPVSTSLRANATEMSNVANLDEGSRHVMGVGRLDSQKGFDLLLRAFAMCRENRPDWKLTILGDGEERERLEALTTQLGIGADVHMPGTVPDTTPFLRRANLFVLSSRYEGFPNALLEAMALGIPVIAADCASGPKRIVSHDVDGLLVPSDDAAALAAAMAALMDDEPRRLRLGQHAVDVTKRFAVDHVMGIWETVIDNIMEGSTSNAGSAST